ncbi:MAG: hypothetical protein ABJF01_05670 [bacterium]
MPTISALTSRRHESDVVRRRLGRNLRAPADVTLAGEAIACAGRLGIRNAIPAEGN